MAEFIQAICLCEGIAVKSCGKSRWEAITPPWKDISAFSTDVLNHATCEKEQKFVQGGAWALNEGYEKRIGNTINVFPKLKLTSDLWEFDNGVLYDLSLGLILQTNQFLVSPSKHHRVDKDQVPYPQLALDFISQRMRNQKQHLPRLLVTLGGLFHPVQDRKTHPALWIQGRSNSYKSWCGGQLLESQLPGRQN